MSFYGRAHESTAFHKTLFVIIVLAYLKDFAIPIMYISVVTVVEFLSVASKIGAILLNIFPLKWFRLMMSLKKWFAKDIQMRKKFFRNTELIFGLQNQT